MAPTHWWAYYLFFCSIFCRSFPVSIFWFWSILWVGQLMGYLVITLYSKISLRCHTWFSITLLWSITECTAKTHCIGMNEICRNISIGILLSWICSGSFATVVRCMRRLFVILDLFSLAGCSLPNFAISQALLGLSYRVTGSNQQLKAIFCISRVRKALLGFLFLEAIGLTFVLFLLFNRWFSVLLCKFLKVSP